MSPLRIGIVGARFSAELHTTHYRPLLGARVEQVEGFAARHAIPWVFTDDRALIASPGVDVVDICATTDSHHEVTIAAARAGKQVIVDAGYVSAATGRRGELARP